MWPLGKLSKASPTPRGEYNSLADSHCGADASICLRHNVANSHEGHTGSQDVTIVRITADNGFVRGNRSQLLVYPRGKYCEEYGPGNATLMDATGTRDTHSRAMSI
jgi:hypothetical protein